MIDDCLSLAIMRFMGDHTMSRGQTDIDCVCFLLKVCFRFVFEAENQ